MADTKERSPWRIRFTRDTLSFGLGALILINELALRTELRPEALAAGITLMGAVPLLRKGDKERDHDRDRSE